MSQSTISLQAGRRLFISTTEMLLSRICCITLCSLVMERWENGRRWCMRRYKHSYCSSSSYYRSKSLSMTDQALLSVRQVDAYIKISKIRLCKNRSQRCRSMVCNQVIWRIWKSSRRQEDLTALCSYLSLSLLEDTPTQSHCSIASCASSMPLLLSTIQDVPDILGQRSELQQVLSLHTIRMCLQKQTSCS